MSLGKCFVLRRNQSAPQAPGSEIHTKESNTNKRRYTPRKVKLTNERNGSTADSRQEREGAGLADVRFAG